MLLRFEEVLCLNQEIKIVSRAFNTFTLFGNMMSKSNGSLYSTVGVSELEEGGGHSIEHSEFYEPTTPVTPSCGRKYKLMAFISFIVTIVGVTFVVSAYSGAERSLESIRRNLSDYTYYKVPFNFAHANDPVVVECTKSVSEIPTILEKRVSLPGKEVFFTWREDFLVLHPTLEEVPYAEHEGESEEDADYGGGGVKEEEREVAYAEYEEEPREEDRSTEVESIYTSGKTSEEEILDHIMEFYPSKEEVAFAEKDREAYAQHKFENGEIPYEVAYTKYVEDLRAELRYREGYAEDEMASEEDDELRYREAYAEHEGESEEYAEYEAYADEEAHELGEEEREESFITPGKTSEEDVLELHTREHADLPDLLALREEMREGEREEPIITPGKTSGEESLGPPSRLFLDMLDIANEEDVAEEEERREEEREEESSLAYVDVHKKKHADLPDLSDLYNAAFYASKEEKEVAYAEEKEAYNEYIMNAISLLQFRKYLSTII